MHDRVTEYPAWKAPKSDESLLVWPEPPTLLENARQAHEALKTSGALIQGVPLGELRRNARTYLGLPETQLVFATGHQAELHHPGVWIKNVVIDAAARAASGVAIHVAVDTDSPKHLSLRWPHFSQPITDDPQLATAEWSGLVSAPTPSHLESLRASLSSTRWAFQPMLDATLETLRSAALEGYESTELPSALSNALHTFDDDLGLKYQMILLSPLLQSEAWLTFVYHLLARAQAFAASYNETLAAFRKRFKIKSDTRPMPDLLVTDSSIEVPFWFDDLVEGLRHRAWVAPEGDHFVLRLPDSGEGLTLDASKPAEEAARELGAFLRQSRHRLSTRALSLTMILRLLVADSFVHGIGGGQYDQVTDTILRDLFGVSPPAFAVATGTLIFPGAVGQPRVCVPCVEMQGHTIKHAVLGDRKRAMVQAIAEAPRGSTQRAKLFSQMRSELDRAAAASPEYAAWKTTLRDTRVRAIEEETLFDRELYVAVQPRERLEGMIAKVQSLFETPG